MSEEFTLPGESLKAERLKQKLTEREVGDKLHLSSSFIKSLEADDYKKLPEAVFIRGYIRNYAKLLGLDGDPLVARFDAMSEPPRIHRTSSIKLPAPALGDKKKLLAILVVVVIVVLALVFAFQPKAPKEAALTDVEPAAQTVETLVEADEPMEALFAEEDSVAAPEDAPLDDSELAQTSGLLVTFAERSWVRVSDVSGQTLFEGEKEAGSQLALTGNAPFQLRFGNGAAVSTVSVNNQSVALPAFREGRVGELQAP